MCVVVYPVNIGQLIYGSNYQLIDKQGCKEVVVLIFRCKGVGV